MHGSHQLAQNQDDRSPPEHGSEIVAPAAERGQVERLRARRQLGRRLLRGLAPADFVGHAAALPVAHDQLDDLLLAHGLAGHDFGLEPADVRVEGHALDLVQPFQGSLDPVGSTHSEGAGLRGGRPSFVAYRNDLGGGRPTGDLRLRIDRRGATRRRADQNDRDDEGLRLMGPPWVVRAILLSVPRSGIKPPFCMRVYRVAPKSRHSRPKVVSKAVTRARSVLRTRFSWLLSAAVRVQL